MSGQIDFEELRQSLDKITIKKDQHVLCTEPFNAQNRFYLMTIANYGRVEPHVAYALLKDFDNHGQVKCKKAPLHKVCEEKKCLACYVRIRNNLTDYCQLDVHEQEYHLKRIENSCIEEKCSVEGLHGNCFLYQKFRDRTGFGTTKMFHKTQFVHRVVFYLHGGEIPQGHILYHLCKKLHCTNIDHLKCSSRAESQNYIKYDKPSRQKKLTKEQVIEIRIALEKNEPASKLAVKYGVSTSHIYTIKSGKQHIDSLTEEQKKMIYEKKRKRESSKKRPKQNKKLISSAEYFNKALIRFQKKVETQIDENKEEHSIWTAGKRGPYGRFIFKNKSFDAHVASYLLHNQLEQIPSGFRVCHKCKEKLCVNINHLELGTALTNMADKKRDGTNTSGDKNPMSKITAEIAKKIKESKGKTTQAERAKQFNTTLHIIQHIDNGTTWKDI